jgi:hypothetical protein
LAFIPLYAAYFVIMGYNRPGLSWMGSLAFSYIFGVPLGYVAVGLLGWPWVAKLRCWHKLTVGYVCLGACVIGMGIFVAFGAVVGNYQSVLAGVAEQLIIGLVLGLLSGLIFCLISGVPLKARD